MKKAILVAFLFAGIASAGFSQEKGHKERTHKSPEERAQLMTDALSKKLSLTDKQKAEVYKVQLDRAKEMEKLKANADERRTKDMAKVKGSFEESEKKIERILDDNQKKTYQELKAQRKEKAQKHKGDFKKRAKQKRGDA